MLLFYYAPWGNSISNEQRWYPFLLIYCAVLYSYNIWNRYDFIVRFKKMEMWLVYSVLDPQE